ncbi:hypothetical protein ACFQ3J_14505 [Paenibacillus provencensis]|uniref:Uncharacterized protein n=1 Tax=Paenibacillus provencensis TaxID=441151 RepID=A0ABW3PUG3_9BACL|nr:hypothetical protein [Paenibacillus sp. MER 78]MCM3127845.1 hypothetical protein [Paenibacillus sp. MER 78]
MRKYRPIVLVREWHRIRGNKEAIPGQIRALTLLPITFRSLRKGSQPRPVSSSSSIGKGSLEKSGI